MEPIRLDRYFECTTSETSMVEVMYGAESSQAQRIAILNQAKIDEKIKLADNVVYVSDDVAGLPLPKVAPVPLRS